MSFSEEIAWFNENRDHLKEKYPNKVLVIFGRKLRGHFVDNMAALHYRLQHWPKNADVLIRNSNHQEGLNVIAPFPINPPGHPLN